MAKTKYIIFRRGVHSLSALVFDEHLIHYDVARAIGYEAISAGFCQIIDDQFRCYGESTSLGIKSRSEDESILDKLIGGRS